MSGKGDRRRPFNQQKWDEGYERVFGSKTPFFDGVRELDKILEETNKQEEKENDNTL